MIATLQQWLTPNGIERHHRSALPRWRGRSHQVALGISVPASLLLIRHASNNDAKWACLVYVATVIGLFSTSSLYNRALGTDRLRPWMRWVDHAMIYALIAGSYTPTCVVTLPRRFGLPLLVMVWSAAAIGAMSKFLMKQRFRIAGGTLYGVIGCAVLVALPQLFTYAPTSASILYLLGGAAYGYGGLSLYRRSPDPRPDLFGYHEVWHVFVVIGAGTHFVANWLSVG
jgi:hemolysin III